MKNKTNNLSSFLSHISFSSIFCLLVTSITPLQAKELSEEQKQNMNSLIDGMTASGIDNKTAGNIYAILNGKLLTGPETFLKSSGIHPVESWEKADGTSVQRIINNTPYFFIAYTRATDKEDTHIEQGLYNPQRYKPGSTLIAPGETVELPKYTFRSEDNIEFVIMVLGPGKNTNEQQHNAFLQKRLPAGLAIVDTGKKGEEKCAKEGKDRVKVDAYVITGGQPTDKIKIDCFWLCAQKTAKRLEIKIDSWDALKGKPEGKWGAPSTLMNYRIQIQQIDNNDWKAKYTKAPAGKPSKEC